MKEVRRIPISRIAITIKKDNKEITIEFIRPYKIKEILEDRETLLSEFIKFMD